ncbi:hypothetical protein CAPTEDRAFT_187559 [Capitella teleta]|uniref:VWFC domain-containing protein n=1 Tax=Capitella teleta TaxID=283909 RepID=R7UDP2_CAPTE|nr:hypothetical protein CAPTEDRAFT_187559 [Capitella teleta]|eukprot:ELU04104.1 hypothetical protein CAPTEDRAFT_187559 [Capitella teleta]
MGTSASPVQPVSPGSSLLMCTDWKGVFVADGEHFIKDEACTKCLCHGGYPVMCNMVHCLPPSCPHYEQVKDECCEFICINLPVEPGRRPDFNVTIHRPPGDAAGDLGLRLIASTVTSVLILALLLFMIYRLRQRRLLIMMRRMNEERREEDAVAYMTTLDQVDIGIEYPAYEEPPPPYYPPKPPDMPPDEPPPPYEEFEQRAEAAVPDDNTRSLPAQIPPNSPDLIPLTTAPDLQLTPEERRSRSRVFRIKDSFLTQGEEEPACTSSQGATASVDPSSQETSVCSEEDCVSVYTERDSAQPLYKHYGFIDGPNQRCSYNSLHRPKQRQNKKRWRSTEICTTLPSTDNDSDESDLPVYRLPCQTHHSPNSCTMPAT